MPAATAVAVRLPGRCDLDGRVAVGQRHADVALVVHGDVTRLTRFMVRAGAGGIDEGRHLPSGGVVVRTAKFLSSGTMKLRCMIRTPICSTLSRIRRQTPRIRHILFTFAARLMRGTAIAAMMPMITTTMTNSTRLNARCLI